MAIDALMFRNGRIVKNLSNTKDISGRVIACFFAPNGVVYKVTHNYMDILYLYAVNSCGDLIENRLDLSSFKWLNVFLSVSDCHSLLKVKFIDSNQEPVLFYLDLTTYSILPSHATIPTNFYSQFLKSSHCWEVTTKFSKSEYRIKKSTKSKYFITIFIADQKLTIDVNYQHMRERFTTETYYQLSRKNGNLLFFWGYTTDGDYFFIELEQIGENFSFLCFTIFHQSSCKDFWPIFCQQRQRFQLFKYYDYTHAFKLIPP